MKDDQLEKLAGFIRSTGEAVGTLAKECVKHAVDSVYSDDPLIEGCPHKAAAAEMELRPLKGRVQELQQLIDQLQTHIYDKYSA